MGSEVETSRVEAADEISHTIEGRYVCPFCGAVREEPEGVCPRCTMESTAATRQATKSRIGPWYVLQTRNPAAPGMKFDTLLTFVRKGRVKAQSIVRGPTTHQLWRFAAQVKGLSREFGVCHGCGQSIARAATICLHCNRLQDPPGNPDIFIEGQDAAALPPATPIYRDIGAAPLVAEDIVVPAMTSQSKPELPDSSEGESFGRTPSGKNRTRKATDGFLTAEDLATAFQLDFQPKERKHKKTPVAPIAMTRDAESSPPPRRRRRWGRGVLLLLVIAALGAGAFQYKRDPSFRGRIDDDYDLASMWTKQKWADLQKTAPKSTHPSAGADGSSIQVATPAGTPSKSPQTPQPAAPTNPWDQLYHQQTSDPISTSVKPAMDKAATDKLAIDKPALDKPAKVDDVPAKPKHRQGTMDDVRALYGGALDAEGQQDFATAVKKYEEIKEFPTDLWPSDLELRLKAAKLQMHQQ